MKILIVYATTNGVSKHACEMLTDRIGSRAVCEMFDIDSAPCPDGYDAVVLGGSIRFGKLQKKLRNYIKANKEKLAAIPSAAFICCGYLKNFEDYAIMQLPRDLHFPLGIHCFGGELKPDKLKGFDKLIVRMVRSSIGSQDPHLDDADRHELPEIMPDTIYALAERLCHAK